MDGSEVHLLGWLHERRDLGGLRFLILRDRSGKVQLIMNRRDTPEEVWRITDGLKRESVLSVTGTVKRSPQAPGGAEVLVGKVELLASSDDLPLDVVGKTEAELDTRLDYRVLDLRRAAPQAIFRIESTTVRAIRSFLDDSGFMEVFTPKIISTATEGGANLFSVFYYDRLAYLSQSPQLYKEVLTSDFERVYEIAPAFRAEESDTLRHLAEVTMVDAEAAFFDYEDVMDLMTGLIKAVVQEVNSENEEDLKALGRSRLEEVDSIPRLEYDEAVKQILPHDRESVVLYESAAACNAAVDMSVDVWLYLTLGYIRLEKSSPDQIGSSTMPQKVNPVDLEGGEGMLRFAARGLESMSHRLQESRLQRDISDSAVKRFYGEVYGLAVTGLRRVGESLDHIRYFREGSLEDLNRHWEVLGEAAQVVLRSRGDDEGYEKVRRRLQGVSMREEEFADAVRDLGPEISSLRPERYLGYACEQAVAFSEEAGRIAQGVIGSRPANRLTDAKLF